MDKTSFSLHIENNCDANWDAMTEQDQGRFCVLCTKVVVDFTNMSDDQIKHFFKDYKGDVCGRFHDKQLDKKYFLGTYQSPWYVSRFLHYAISGLLTLKLSDGIAVQPKTIQTEINPVEKNLKGEAEKLPSRSERIVSGKVITAGEKGLSEVTVTVEETGQTFKTGSNGKFKITLPGDFKGETVKLNFTRLYYQSTSQSVSVQKAETLVIRMYPENIRKGRVIKQGKVKVD